MSNASASFIIFSSGFTGGIRVSTKPLRSGSFGASCLNWNCRRWTSRSSAFGRRADMCQYPPDRDAQEQVELAVEMTAWHGEFRALRRPLELRSEERRVGKECRSR